VLGDPPATTPGGPVVTLDGTTVADIHRGSDRTAVRWRTRGGSLCDVDRSDRSTDAPHSVRCDDGPALIPAQRRAASTADDSSHTAAGIDSRATPLLASAAESCANQPSGGHPMTIKHEAHKACIIVRTYPESSFWLMTCAALAAGVAGNYYVLTPLLAAQLLMIGHVVRRMWSPPIVIAVRPETGQVVLPTQSRAPGMERHRHARH